MDSYLRQYQSFIYQGNMPMFNTITQSPTVFNTNYQIISDKNDEQISSDQLREKLRKQLEYYFSRENMINDGYLQSQMDVDNYVPISLIANFKLIKRLTQDLQLIIDVLKESPLVEVDIEEKKVRSSDTKTNLPTRKRCIIILRNVPFNATANEILELFINKYCSVSAIGCERVLESDHSDCWYVTFNSEEDAQNAFLYLTRENISIRGQKILARMKACLWQKSSIPTQELYIPPAPINHSIENLPQQYYNPNILTLSYPAATQQINTNFSQQTQFINRNHPIFPTHFWYIPSPTTDSYSSMIVPLNSIIRSYNGINRSKAWIIASKSRNSIKSISNHDGLSQNNTLHSSILRNETPNTSLQSTQP